MEPLWGCSPVFQPGRHEPSSRLTRVAAWLAAETEEKGSEIPGLRPPIVGGAQGSFSPRLGQTGTNPVSTSPAMVGSAGVSFPEKRRWLSLALQFCWPAVLGGNGPR